MSATSDPVAALRRWMARQDLARAEVAELFGRLMDGELPEGLQGALLVALALKGETVEEIAGAAEAMRARAVAVPHAVAGVVDTCGTGGDGRGGFNVSTAAAFVAAAAGAPVAKHGNRAVSSRSGSADVLAALGVAVEVAPATAARQLAEIGLAFLFAPAYHPAMREVAPVRRALGVRTVFNLVGPLTNPARARRQVMGVFAADRVEPIARVLAGLGAEHALVVHGSDGLDEITTTGPTRVAEVRDGALETYEIDPAALGVGTAESADLAGGSPEENARRMEELLAGGAGDRRRRRLAELVAVNAGAALYVAGRAPTLRAGVELALEVLAGGAGRAKLEALRSFAP